MKNPIKKLIKLWMGGMSFIAAVLLISTGAGATAGQKDLRVSAEAAWRYGSAIRNGFI